MDSPRRRFDPAALAVFGVAVVLLVAASAYLVLRVSQDPAIPPAKPKPRPAPPPVAAKKPAPAPSPQPAAKPAAADPLPSELIPKHGSGRSWRYRVELDPPQWRDATLFYRVAESTASGALVVDTSFQHAGGKMDFRLGTYAAGHPSHGQTRFPGFFLYGAYLDRPLQVGQQFSWEWPWQYDNGAMRAGRVKRFVGEVKARENLPAAPGLNAPGGMLGTARIEGMLYYLEDGQQRGAVAETFWFAPRYLQIVKIVRDGKSPDEGPLRRIAAELIEHTYP